MVQEGGSHQPISSILETEIPRTVLGTGLETVLDGLAGGAPAVAICSAEGRMIGYVTRENIGELMVIYGR